MTIDSGPTGILEQTCRAAAAEGLLLGAVVAAGGQDSLDLLWSWGHASVRPAIRAMSPEMVFDVASVTKVVATATAAALCFDRGLLNPAAPARDYLPRLGDLDHSPIRVRDLACHVSGFDNRKFHCFETPGWMDRIIEAPASRPPRERYEYSCRNFIVLGRIVEVVSGLDLATFCDRNVFRPFGMTQTAFGPRNHDLDRVVPTHQPAGTISDEQAQAARHPIGNAGLFSNARDLSRFCRLLLRRGHHPGGRLLTSKGLDLLFRSCSPPGLPQRSFGWDMRPVSQCHHRPSSLSPKAIGHSGWTGQSVWIDPAFNRYVIVLTNRTHVGDKAASTHAASEYFRARIADLALENLPDRYHRTRTET